MEEQHRPRLVRRTIKVSDIARGCLFGRHTGGNSSFSGSLLPLSGRADKLAKTPSDPEPPPTILVGLEPDAVGAGAPG